MILLRLALAIARLKCARYRTTALHWLGLKADVDPLARAIARAKVAMRRADAVYEEASR